MLFSLQLVIKDTNTPTPTPKKRQTQPSSLTKEERELIKGWKGNIAGDEVEEKVFNKFRKTLRDNSVKNTLVIHGWKDEGKGKGEYDFVIVSDPLKMVFLIEVKKSKKGKRKAAKQLPRGMDFFKQSLILPKEEKWNFVRVMYFENRIDVCPDCTEFVLTPDTNLDEWWKNFEPINQEQHERESNWNECSYIQNCKFLLHQMFIQSQVITEADITKNSEDFFKKSCNADLHKTEADKKGFCFLTRVQFNLFHDPAKKRVIFSSAYGTGKTLLLKAKAKELLLKGEKVVIVLFDKFKSIFQFLLKKNYDQEFKAFANNVKVKLIKCQGNTFLSPCM